MFIGFSWTVEESHTVFVKSRGSVLRIELKIIFSFSFFRSQVVNFLPRNVSATTRVETNNFTWHLSLLVNQKDGVPVRVGRKVFYLDSRSHWRPTGSVYCYILTGLDLTPVRKKIYSRDGSRLVPQRFLGGQDSNGERVPGGRSNPTSYLLYSELFLDLGFCFC